MFWLVVTVLYSCEVQCYLYLFLVLCYKRYHFFVFYCCLFVAVLDGTQFDEN